MLQEYDFLLCHILGKDNTKADILSRNIKPDMSNDNKELTMFKDKILIRKIQEETTIYEGTLTNNRSLEILVDSMLLEDIKECKRRESRVLQEMEKQPKKLWESEGIIYQNGKIYVSNSQEICGCILHEHHDSPDMGHPRIHHMLELVKRSFWWPMIKIDVT
jgi:Flp pilus assembly CpaF family ATPase